MKSINKIYKEFRCISVHPSKLRHTKCDLFAPKMVFKPGWHLLSVSSIKQNYLIKNCFSLYTMISLKIKRYYEKIQYEAKYIFCDIFALKIDNLFKVTRHVPRKMIIMFQILNDLIIYQIKIYHYLLLFQNDKNSKNVYIYVLLFYISNSGVFSIRLYLKLHTLESFANAW